jgi:hypothetical protein
MNGTCLGWQVSILEKAVMFLMEDIFIYEDYSESNLHSLLATSVGAGVASHDSLPWKPSHNWSPVVWSCLLLSELWCVPRLIILPAAVYGQNVMSEGTVRQWCRMFKDGRTNVHDEERGGRPSAVSDWSCSKCSPKNLWKTALHNFRTFVWISTHFMHRSLWDYHR